MTIINKIRRICVAMYVLGNRYELIERFSNNEILVARALFMLVLSFLICSL